MKHLLVSREYPPSSYPRGGIGTYVEHIARLLAERGETVHVVAELWDGAPREREERIDGRLVIHRVPMGYPMATTASAARAEVARVLDAMAGSPFPAQSFAWQAALLIERLVETEGIDVIEGQDYEAPLYYLLARRALGLGPSTRPPCFVHLHTPWEFVCHANGWGLASAYDVTIKRLEDYAIAAADAALCPSAFLAEQAARHYGLDAVERIPYPIGPTPFIERASATWDTGTICYFGRLEARKGVLEWLAAAIEVARRRQGLRFELIGADTPLTGEPGSSMRQALLARVPGELRAAFTFTEALPREALQQRLAQARLAVVPSRWENFPNTCVEAMCSGLPVLVSPHGGMVEMIDDGRTGWVAASGRSVDLAATLTRALETPPATLAAMGRAASDAIRQQCDNERTLDRHLTFRRELVARGASRSLRIPRLPTWQPPVVRPPSNVAPVPVVPTAVVTTHGHEIATVAVTGAIDVGAAADAAAGALGVALVVPQWRPRPTFIEACGAVLAGHPDIGVVGAWRGRDRGVAGIEPHPARPYQWVATGDAPVCVVVRTTALESLRWIGERGSRVSMSDLVMVLLAEEWLAVTYPAVGFDRTAADASERDATERSEQSRIRLVILDRYRERLAEDAPLLVHLSQAMEAAGTDRHIGRGALSLGTVWRLPVREQLALAGRAVRSPRYALRWLWRRSNGGGGAA